MQIATTGALAVSLVVLTACSLPETLEEQGIVTIEMQEENRVGFVYVSAFPKDSGFEVVGLVRRTSFGGEMYIAGHIDVTILTPTGNKTTAFEIPLRMRHRPRQTARKASFYLKYKILPPSGSTLTVAYHEGTHEVRRK